MLLSVGRGRGLSRGRGGGGADHGRIGWDHGVRLAQPRQVVAHQIEGRVGGCRRGCDPGTTWKNIVRYRLLRADAGGKSKTVDLTYRIWLAHEAKPAALIDALHQRDGILKADWSVR